MTFSPSWDHFWAVTTCFFLARYYHRDPGQFHGGSQRCRVPLGQTNVTPSELCHESQSSVTRSVDLEKQLQLSALSKSEGTERTQWLSSLRPNPEGSCPVSPHSSRPTGATAPPPGRACIAAHLAGGQTALLTPNAQCPKGIFCYVTNLMRPLPQTPIHVMVKICKCSRWQHPTSVNEIGGSGSPLPAPLCLGPQTSVEVTGVSDTSYPCVLFPTHLCTSAGPTQRTL